MSPIEFKYHGVTFYITPESMSASTNPYPLWTSARQATTVRTDQRGGHRMSVHMCQGVRYHGRLRKRILRAARKAHPHEVLPDDAPIMFALEVGFDYVDHPMEETEDRAIEVISRPELWLSISPQSGYFPWAKYNSPERSSLQRILDRDTFGMEMESTLEDVWDKKAGADGLLRWEDQDEMATEWLERALRALHSPPPKAPAFPTSFQRDVIEWFKPHDVDVSEYDWIIDDTVDTLAALGLDTDKKRVFWDTYPTSGAAKIDSMTMLDVLKGALSEKADARMTEGPDIAKAIEQYRSTVCTPKNLLLMAVPLYADAFASVDVTFKADRARQEVSWETASDFDEALEKHDPESEKNAEVETVIEAIADDIKDAVETLLDGMAKRCDEHYDYVTSDEGVWESAEGCGDFDDIFISHINRD